MGRAVRAVPSLALRRRVRRASPTRLPAFGRCHFLWQIPSADVFLAFSKSTHPLRPSYLFGTAAEPRSGVPLDLPLRGRR
jgi:hypothetical protein